MKLNLIKGSWYYNGLAVSRRDSAVMIGFVRETNVINVIEMFLIVFRLHWPPVKWVSGLFNTDQMRQEIEEIEREIQRGAGKNETL